MELKLSASLPKEKTERNGLEGVRVARDGSLWVVGKLVPKKVTEDLIEGGETMTLVFDHIESVDRADVDTVVDIATDRFNERTGRQPLTPIKGAKKKSANSRK